MQFNYRVPQRIGLRLAGVLILALGSGISPAFAESVPDLEMGMSSAEVLRLWGAPAEKTERETKREDIWHYANRTVTFAGGKVSNWKLDEAQGQEAKRLTVPPETAQSNPAVEELLTDILADEQQ